MTDFRPIIARKLRSGPLYMRSFQPLKSTVEAMINAGHARRVAPPGLRAKNMVELTEDGRRRYLGELA